MGMQPQPSRRFYMLMGGASSVVVPPLPAFDIRDYWLGVELFELNDAADTRDLWLLG